MTFFAEVDSRLDASAPVAADRAPATRVDVLEGEAADLYTEASLVAADLPTTDPNDASGELITRRSASPHA